MVDILMATYNGEKYIAEQIDSILNQNYEDWKLYIRDDGSNDKTLEIIKKYIYNYPEKIILIEDSKKNLGVKLNFTELMKYSESDYCMFCDQDDVWLKDKITLTLNNMIDMESKYGKDTPILVHTDLKVVDTKLNILNESFWNFININPTRNNLNQLLVENTVTGCTAMINKSLRILSSDIPNECVMHDWWLAIIASTMGKICVVNDATILYRQHLNNQIGARRKSVLEKFKNTKIDFNNNQVKVFLDMYDLKLSNEQKEILHKFFMLDKANFIKRRYIFLKNKYFWNNKVRNIKVFLFM